MITCACGGAPQAGPSPVTAPATATLAAPPTIVDGVTGQPVVATIEDLMVARGGRGGAQFSAAELEQLAMVYRHRGAGNAWPDVAP